jgi:hypothetical protein
VAEVMGKARHINHVGVQPQINGHFSPDLSDLE